MGAQPPYPQANRGGGSGGEERHLAQIRGRSSKEKITIFRNSYGSKNGAFWGQIGANLHQICILCNFFDLLRLFARVCAGA